MNKQKFDPNKPYSEVSNRKDVSKPKFDPSIPYKEIQSEVPWREVPGRAFNEIAEMGKGISTIGKGVAKIMSASPEELSAMGQKYGPIFRRPEFWKAAGRDLVSPYVKTYQGIVEGQPLREFRERPVGTALAFAPLIGKIAKGASELPLIGKVIKAPSKTASFLARKGTSAFGVPEEAISARFANPSIIRNAPELSEIANEKLPKIGAKFDEMIGSMKGEAKKTLSSSLDVKRGALTKDEILGSIAKARANLGGVYTPEAETASRTLERINENVSRIRGTTSQKWVGGLIEDIDKEIPWEKVWRSPQDLTFTDKALIDVRSKLDSLLKGKNPIYQEKMIPLSDTIESRNEFLKHFSMERIKKGGYRPTNTTISRLAGTTKDDRVTSQRIMKNVEAKTGENVIPEVQRSQYKSMFESTGKPTWRSVLGFKPETAGKITDFGRNLTDNLKAAGKAAIISSPLIGAILTKKDAREYLKRANGDKALARELALRDGKRIP